MEREKLIENMMTFFPMLHKKMHKSWPNLGLSKLQFELLFTILKADSRPMSFYSDKLMIPRSNLTGLSDKLIEEGLVERLPDSEDRRVIILKLTEKGHDYLQEHRQIVKQEMLKMLDSLSDDDVKRLNQLIGEIRMIFDKII